ncbi:MAG: DNA repair protein RecN [Oscillospiraceae bacterium]
MLDLLHIENIAIIEQADISFRPGFNVLTGETGAGKSIVIDALSAVLGQRASRELIRTGADHAFVSAVFSGIPQGLGADLGVADAEEWLLQREIYVDGKNVCRLNGRPMTVTQLRTLGSRLLNIHGQHDGQQLLDEAQHILYLDQYGRYMPLQIAYQEKYSALQRIENQISALQMDEAEKTRRIDTLQFQIQDLERANLQSGEEEELLERRNLLRNSEKIISAVQGADYCLNGDDQREGALSLLRQAQEQLSTVRGLGDSFAQLTERINAVYSELYDIAYTVQDKKDELDFAPGELDTVELRCDQLYRLKKKYGATVEDMMAYLEKCRQELDQITLADDTLAQLQKHREKALKEALAAARELSQQRKAAAQSLEKQILTELQELNMGSIRFQVAFVEKKLDATGMDEVRFLMSANVGEELRPIQKIASGGELARIMLAMKNVFSQQEKLGTMVFDEVDTGVSGRAAQKVAEKMAKISRQKQVLCVTHLPQLAAMADTHFSVEKGVSGGRTFTRVQEQTRQQRREELARLTGSGQTSQTMIDSAEELLSAADAFKKALV